MQVGIASSMWRGIVDLLTDTRVLHGCTAMACDADLVLEVVVVGAVVVHHDQQRDPAVRRGPERSGVVHEVAVGLDVDDDRVGAAVRETDAERHADLRGRAE